MFTDPERLKRIRAALDQRLNHVAIAVEALYQIGRAHV